MLLGTKRERTGAKKGANRGQKGSEPGTKRERTGDVAKMCLLFDQGGDSNYLNKRVLKPIIEECGPLLGLKIERQYVKRRLSGFVFTFARETPPVIDARPVEARKAEDAGHWTSVAGYGEVFTTTELFDVTAARDHFDGTVEAGECRFCAFDARNREHHAQNAGKLF